LIVLSQWNAAMGYRSIWQITLPTLVVGQILCPSLALANCTISSVSGLNFGAYSSFDTAPTDATGQFIFTCSDVQGPVTIRLSTGVANSFTPRQMALGTARLNYNLYIDTARTQIWGDGTGGSSLRTLTPVNNAPTTLDIFGRISPRQFIPAGNYADTITITIQF